MQTATITNRVATVSTYAVDLDVWSDGQTFWVAESFYAGYGQTLYRSYLRGDKRDTGWLTGLATCEGAQYVSRGYLLDDLITMLECDTDDAKLFGVSDDWVDSYTALLHTIRYLDLRADEIEVAEVLLADGWTDGYMELRRVARAICK